MKLYATAFGSPLDPQHELAHFYRYEEIVDGWKLEPNPTPPADFHNADASIPFDKDGVYPVITNPRVFGYAPGSAAAIYNDTFNRLTTTPACSRPFQPIDCCHRVAGVSQATPVRDEVCDYNRTRETRL